MKSDNVIILHGCPSSSEANIERSRDSARRTYDKHWIPWTKQQLARQGIHHVQIPLMPNPWLPDYAAFKKAFETSCTVNTNTIIVAHSCGCAFIVRWLGETKREIAKLILVAPWKIPDEDDEYRKEFYSYTIDASIKERVQKIIIFTSDDEEEDGKKSAKIFYEALGSKVIELKGRGHYTKGDMGTEEFPELIEAIISKKEAL